jgi:hypothetical protein
MASRTIRRTGVAAAAALTLAMPAIGLAAPLAATPPIPTTAPSPFAACTNIGPGGTNYVNAEVEPWVEVDPTNPGTIIGAIQQDRWNDGGARGLVTPVSHDNGATWHDTFAAFTFCSGGTGANGGDFERASDPWVTFSPNGVVHQIAIGFNGSDNENAVLVSKSTDHGETWSNATTLIRDAGDRTDAYAFNDKESITADPTNSNYVYAVWDRLVSPQPQSRASLQGLIHSRVFRGPTYFARTTDGGATWQPARVIYDPGSHDQTISNQIAVLPDGTLVDTFVQFIRDNGPQPRGVSVGVVRSTDKGTTWSKPIFVAADRSIGVSDPDTGAPVRTGDIINDIGVDPATGAVYLVWQDASVNGGVDGIALSKSTDGGLTWSTPRRVNQGPLGVQAFTGSVAVLADGTVGVTYYDFRNNTADPATLPTDYFLAHSHDGGLTWTETRVTPTSFDMATAPVALGFFVGDYEGLAVSGNRFVAHFVATNSGNLANRTDGFVSFIGP